MYVIKYFVHVCIIIALITPTCSTSYSLVSSEGMWKYARGSFDTVDIIY